MNQENNEQSMLMSAFALCPTDLSHPQKMKWIGDYFLKNYVPWVPAYTPPSQEECDSLHYKPGSWTVKFREVHKAGWNQAKEAYEARLSKL